MTVPLHGDLTTAANLHRFGVVSSADPGAIGAWKAWIDQDNGQFYIRNAADSGWYGPYAFVADITATKLDDLAAPDDNTDLNVSTTAHGLAPKLPNDATKFLDGTGGYTVPSGSGIPATIVDAKGDLIAATAADTVARLAVGSNGQRLKADSAQSTGLAWVEDVVTVPFIIDGGGAVITTGVKGDLEIAFAGTITAWRVLGDQSGSITIDTWKDTYANFPPTVADTMWGTKPNLSAAAKNQGTGLSIAVAAGDIIRYNVDSASTVTRVTLSFTIAKT